MMHLEQIVASSPKLCKMEEFIKQGSNLPADDRERVPDRYVAYSLGASAL